jgi:hypothetical protein
MVAAKTEMNAASMWVRACQLVKYESRKWKYVLAVFVNGEIACPRVEKLEGTCARIKLAANRCNGMFSETLHQLVPERSVGVHHLFRNQVIAAWFAFNQVTADSEWRAGERK